MQDEPLNPCDFFHIPEYKIEMSSADRFRAQIPANKLYINIGGIQSTIFKEDGTTKVEWVSGLAALSTTGTAILRDMGVTKYVPAPEVTGASPFQSTLLRKVQLVTGSDASGIAYSSSASNYYTGYIKMGAQTFGGASDPTCAQVARLN
jgi:hypothetical protein